MKNETDASNLSKFGHGLISACHASGLVLATSLTAEGREKRIQTLGRAAERGADGSALCLLASALRVARKDMITLPPHRFERLSRGKGWARKGKGAAAQWGERTDDGYAVGPGRWVVGGNDGFSRKGEDVWVVEAVEVGDETWTVAS